MKKVIGVIIACILGAAILYVLENWGRIFHRGAIQYVDPDDFEGRLR